MCLSRLWSGHEVIVNSGTGSYTPFFSLDSASVQCALCVCIEKLDKGDVESSMKVTILIRKAVFAIS